MNDLKQCRMCGEFKKINQINPEEDDFSTRKEVYNGKKGSKVYIYYRPQCKECDNKINRANYVKSHRLSVKKERPIKKEINLAPLNRKRNITVKEKTRSELAVLSKYEDRLKYMGWKDCLMSKEILSRYVNGEWK